MPRPKRNGPRKPNQQTLSNEEAIDESTASLASHSSYTDSQNMAGGTANEAASLQAILEELRASRRENENNFQEIKEEMRNITRRVTEAENRINEVDDRTQRIEEATMELSRLQEKMEAKIIDMEGRTRRDNLRFHGIAEGSENGSASVSAFIEGLLKSKLDIPSTLEVNTERAHRSLGPKPPPDAPPRSIVAKFSSFKAKEQVLRLVWQMKGFSLDGKKVIVDHDYAPEVLKLRREYTEAKRILKDNKIKFQTPYPARMRVFYNDETRLYNNASEATEDMAKRGFTVNIVRSRISWAEKIRRAMWHRVDRADKQTPPGDGSSAGYKKRLEAFRRK